MFKNVKLFGRVDRSARVQKNDTLQTKRALKALGFYETPGYGLTPCPYVDEHGNLILEGENPRNEKPIWPHTKT